MEAGSLYKKASGRSEKASWYPKQKVMKEQTTVSRNFKIITLLLTAIGAVTIILGLITDRQTTWANYLIVNYYFLSLAMEGLSFLSYRAYLNRDGHQLSNGFQKP